ncbi:SDR family oxidoreductase [Lichenihabitans sp. PAMC28606]|uniref:SDR family oxidoreductase n=1 Tax=Lichenihabitans sp. PAMC28606 TaxID=2880932 RepID=UPI001D0A987C|nr:SDR family oxidoreductase [Lichenihabitans sp. PAMC28606]UDL95731.1 SDR family oxidoreductase [Lichenihabitans sp. PAMC28606]
MSHDANPAFAKTATPSNEPLAGKVALITGATQGLGKAVAERFAATGASGLILCGRNTTNGAAIAAALNRDGCRTIFVRTDLSSVADCRAAVARADAEFGRLDILVNAGGITDRGNIFDTTEEGFDRMFATNVRGPFFLMQDAVLLMRRERIEGSIVNIQSMAAHGGQAFIAAYSASKAALAALTRNTAHALLNYRIRVNGLNIGWMATPGEDATMKTYHGAADGWLDAAMKTRPFGRLIDPDEVARACVYLASSQSGLMTGSNIDFDQTVTGAADAPLARED